MQVQYILILPSSKFFLFFLGSLGRVDEKLLSNQAKKKKKNEKEKNNMIQPWMPIMSPFEDIF
jgi:hypothetical protein